MYLIREIIHCKPGKTRQMLEKFRAISAALKEMGHQPLRLLTDISGEPYWTIVAEAEVDTVEAFFAAEEKLTASEPVRKAMADYHDLVQSGRREMFRVEE
jgi:hypothetical protein